MKVKDTQAVIQVRDLVTHYGPRLILKGISLDVAEGEIMIIMGGSGSGKSTLLRYLMALEVPTSGSILLNGQDVGSSDIRRLIELRKGIGVAFQGGALFSSMTVGENIILPLIEHTDLDRQTMEIMARMKLELVDLAGFEDLMPAELSGGMIKRVAFARAVIMDPKILFCDEPSAGLDPVVASALDELILRLREALNMTVVVVTHELESVFKIADRVTVVVVTHELESVFKIADRVTVLDKGEILFIGTIKELRKSKSERIQNLLNRQAEDEPVDAEEYLRRLTGDDIQLAQEGSL